MSSSRSRGGQQGGRPLPPTSSYTGYSGYSRSPAIVAAANSVAGQPDDDLFGPQPPPQRLLPSSANEGDWPQPPAPAGYLPPPHPAASYNADQQRPRMQPRAPQQQHYQQPQQPHQPPQQQQSVTRRDWEAEQDRQPLPVLEYPTDEDIQRLLTDLYPVFAGAVSGRPRDNYVCHRPQLAPAIGELDWLREPSRPPLRGDFKPGRNPRFPEKDVAKAKYILEFLNLGAARAYRQDPPIGICSPGTAIWFHNEQWSQPRDGPPASNAILMVWGPSEKGVLVMARPAEMTMIVPGGTKAKAAPLFLLDSDSDKPHKMKCGCVLRIARNNYPFLEFSLVCMHRQLLVDYSNHEFIDVTDFVATANGEKIVPEAANLAALNRSIMFSGYVSTAGTVLPRMTMRAPLSSLKRTKPRLFKPMMAEYDMLDHLFLFLGYGNQIGRDFPQFVRHFTQECGEGTPGHPCRFPPLEDQLRSTDVMLRSTQADPISLDYLLNNSVFVAPFHGATYCCYCSAVVEMSGLPSLIQHLMQEHSRLQESIFSCPTCVTVTPLDWASYLDHFQVTHHASSAMLVVLDETAVSSRTAWGLALQAVISTLATANLVFPIRASEPADMVTNLGGYRPKGPNSHEALRKAVVTYRQQQMPQDLVTEARARYIKKQRAKQAAHNAAMASYSAAASRAAESIAREAAPPRQAVSRAPVVASRPLPPIVRPPPPLEPANKTPAAAADLAPESATDILRQTGAIREEAKSPPPKKPHLVGKPGTKKGVPKKERVAAAAAAAAASNEAASSASTSTPVRSPPEPKAAAEQAELGSPQPSPAAAAADVPTDWYEEAERERVERETRAAAKPRPSTSKSETASTTVGQIVDAAVALAVSSGDAAGPRDSDPYAVFDEELPLDDTLPDEQEPPPDGADPLADDPNDSDAGKYSPGRDNDSELDELLYGDL